MSTPAVPDRPRTAGRSGRRWRWRVAIVLVTLVAGVDPGTGRRHAGAGRPRPSITAPVDTTPPPCPRPPRPRRRPRHRPRPPAGDRPRRVRRRPRHRPRPVPARRARRRRRRPLGPGRGARPDRARRSSPSTRSRPRSPAGPKAFYTTPLKALSNQKFTDFSARYGRDQVGLLTGDNTIHGEAPVVVMTTEVLRNMIYAGLLDARRPRPRRARRGPLPPGPLPWPGLGGGHRPPRPHDPARVPVGDGLERRRGRRLDRIGPGPHRRGRRGAPAGHPPQLVPRRGSGAATTSSCSRPSSGPRTGDRVSSRTRRPSGSPAGPPQPPGRQAGPAPDPDPRGGRRAARPRGHAPGDRLRLQPGRAATRRSSTPAPARVALTTPEERAAIRHIADAHTASLADDELAVLGVPAWRDALEAGVGAHHAGLVPPLKEAVEEAFTAGLVKVVFATETLALGVNMPARTVVIEKLTKFTGERHEFLTPGEYTQLTGRAGRRGIDDVGNAVVLWSPFVHFDQVASLAVPGVRPARVGVPPHLQHGGQPGRPLRPRDRPPPAQPVVRPVPGRPRRRDARARARPGPGPPGPGPRRRSAASDSGRAGARVPARHPRRDRQRDRRARARRPAPRRPPRHPHRGHRPGRTTGRAPRHGDRHRQGRAPHGPRRLRRAPGAGHPRRRCPSRTRRAARRSGAGVADAARRARVPAGAPVAQGRTRDPAAAPRRATVPRMPRPRSPGPRRTSPGSSAGSGPEARASAGSSTTVLQLLESWGYVDEWSLTPAGDAARPSVVGDRPPRRRGAARGLARRARRRPRSPRWCRASPTSVGARTATPRCRRCAGRRSGSPTPTAGSSDAGATSTTPRTTCASRPPGRPTRGSPR